MAEKRITHKWLGSMLTASVDGKLTEITPLLKDIKGSYGSDSSGSELTRSSEEYDSSYLRQDQQYQSKVGILPTTVIECCTWDRWITVSLLLTELCERLTFVGISCNLLLFCTSVLKVSYLSAMTINLLFIGVCYMLPVIGGWLAEVYLGCFYTILGGCILYCFGVSLLPVVSWGFDVKNTTSNEHVDDRVLNMSQIRLLSWLALLLIALGCGGIKSNISSFGAHQLVHKGDDTVRTFFTWFYWLITLGTGLAVTFVAYIQQEVSFSIGYMVCAGSMLLSTILFVLPVKLYRYRSPTGNAIGGISKIVRTLRESKFSCAADATGCSEGQVGVQGVGVLVRLVPLFACLVLLGTVFAQGTSSFILQGERLNLQIGSFTVPVVSLSVFSVVAALLLIPLLDNGLFPLLVNIGIQPTKLRRFGCGLFFTIPALCLAAILEIQRKQELSDSGGFDQNVAGLVYNSSHISVFTLMPQYCFLGLSEAFAVISGLEVASSQFPSSLKSLVTGLVMFSIALGFMCAVGLVVIVNALTEPNWFPNEINDGLLEYYYLLLAAIMTVTLVAFTVYSRCSFMYKNHIQSDPTDTTQKHRKYSAPRESSLSCNPKRSVSHQDLLISNVETVEMFDGKVVM